MPTIAIRDAAVAKDLRDDFVRTLVFLPNAHVVGELDQLARALLLEGGCDPGELAPGGNHHSECALAVPPPHSGEVEHARAAFEENGIDGIFGHEPACLFDAGTPLVVGDRRHGR